MTQARITNVFTVGSVKLSGFVRFTRKFDRLYKIECVKRETR